jgi:hypothetical protein
VDLCPLVPVLLAFSKGCPVYMTPGNDLVVSGGRGVGWWGWRLSIFLSCRPEHCLMVLSQSDDSCFPSWRVLLELDIDRFVLDCKYRRKFVNNDQ